MREPSTVGSPAQGARAWGTGRPQEQTGSQHCPAVVSSISSMTVCSQEILPAVVTNALFSPGSTERTFLPRERAGVVPGPSAPRVACAPGSAPTGQVTKGLTPPLQSLVGLTAQGPQEALCTLVLC